MNPDIREINHLALIAGGGRFPFLLIQSARELSIPVTVFAINGVTSPELANQVERIYWLELGEALSRFIEHCHADGIRYVVMGGRMAHNMIWRYRGFDKRSLRVLARMVTRRADGILGTVSDELAHDGIQMLDQSFLLKNCMPERGLLTPRRALTRTEKKDIKFGFPLAREIAGMDIGQTVVVKDLAVVAVEGLDGTDETILRAGRISGGGNVVIKVCKPHQDSRFDIPVIGPDTVRTLQQAGGGALAVMANETLFFDREEAVQLAQEAGIAIVSI